MKHQKPNNKRKATSKSKGNPYQQYVHARSQPNIILNNNDMQNDNKSSQIKRWL